MDWTQILTVVGSVIAIMGSNIAMMLWARSEASSDHRLMLGIIDGIRQEMKDFHGRLCSIEEAKKSILISPHIGECGWHMSIAHPRRDPTWQEIRDAWYQLVPDAKNRTGAMYFPPEKELVKIQLNTPKNSCALTLRFWGPLSIEFLGVFSCIFTSILVVKTM